MSEKVETFGGWLCRERTRRGISQRRLAILMDLSQPTVHKWESGDATPTDTNIKKLAEVLDIEEGAIHERLGRVDRNRQWSRDVTALADQIEQLQPGDRQTIEVLVRSLAGRQPESR